MSSQVIERERNDIRQLNKYLRACIEYPDFILRYIKLDHYSLSISVFCTVNFAKNADMSSQLGILVKLMDSTGRTNVIHYSSTMTRRVPRSSLAAELFTVVQGFDMSTAIRLTLNSIFRKNFLQRIYTDSKGLYDSIVRINSTTEKRLLTDLFMLRQSYQRREMNDVYWILTGQNREDT